VELALNLAILGAAVAGSVGFVANGMLESRRGTGHPVLRWMRNLGVAVVWPLLILRAFVV
jgi:hypothetical protein